MENNSSTKLYYYGKSICSNMVRFITHYYKVPCEEVHVDLLNSEPPQYEEWFLSLSPKGYVSLIKAVYFSVLIKAKGPSLCRQRSSHYRQCCHHKLSWEDIAEALSKGTRNLHFRDAKGASQCKLFFPNIW